MHTSEDATKIHGGIRPWIHNPWPSGPQSMSRAVALNLMSVMATPLFPEPA